MDRCYRNSEWVPAAGTSVTLTGKQTRQEFRWPGVGGGQCVCVMKATDRTQRQRPEEGQVPPIAIRWDPL